MAKIGHMIPFSDGGGGAIFLEIKGLCLMPAQNFVLLPCEDDRCDLPS